MRVEWIFVLRGRLDSRLRGNDGVGAPWVVVGGSWFDKFRMSDQDLDERQKQVWTCGFIVT